MPPGAEGNAPGVDPLKYQKPATVTAASDELMHVKLRFKPPTGDTSELISFPVQDSEKTIDAASVDLRFAAAVALFGMKLRGSEHAKQFDYTAAHHLAATALGGDPHGHRRGLLALVERAARLAGEPISASASVVAK